MKSKLLTAFLAVSLFFVGPACAANNRGTHQDAGNYQAQVRQLVALSAMVGMSPRTLTAAYVHNNHAAYQFRQLATPGGPGVQPEFVLPFIFHFGRWVWIYARKEWPRILSFLIFAYNHGPDLIEAVKDFFSAEEVGSICGTYQEYLDSDEGETDGYDDNDGYDEEEYDIDDEDEKNLDLLCHENPM